VKITVPGLSLVLLVGPSGSGKTTFARRHFLPEEILSSDHYRGVVANDPRSQEATRDAFDTMMFIAERRLARGLLTVIDATNVSEDDRRGWIFLAKQHHVMVAAIVFDVPVSECARRVEARADRPVPRQVIGSQAQQLKAGQRALERIRYLTRLRPGEVDDVTIERARASQDLREDAGPFDIIGDVHGCMDELLLLVEKLGWTVSVEGTGGSARWRASHPEGRKLLFLGDLVDRGPRVVDCLRFVMDLCADGVARCVPGNHEAKLQRWLQGRNVTLKHGLDLSVAELRAEPAGFRDEVERWIDRLIGHLILDGGRLVVAHAGMKEGMIGRAGGGVREFALYGETTGEIDAYGLPVRAPWADAYRGRASVVYGHTPVLEARWVNHTLCIDTGCVFGGKLTALRWPERELEDVPAARVYCEPVRPLAPDETAPSSPDDLGDVGELLAGATVKTRVGLNVSYPAEGAGAAIEALSRFTVHPRWLVYLPPTMSPTDASERADALERPEEAFAWYERHGVTKVVCQEKHMGSRAVVIVARTPEALAARFGGPVGPAGRVLTRRGRAFFDSDEAMEAALVARVQAAATAAGLWEALGSEWMVLDAELMPWSAKARALLVGQYAPVSAAAVAATSAAVDVVRAAAARSSGAEGLVASAEARREAATRYGEAWRRYVWEVNGVDDLRLAPFHLLASEGAVHTDKDHGWHLSTLARLAAHDPVLVATRAVEVDLADPASREAAIAQWEAWTEAGGEGMVVKPWSFLVSHRGRVLQPAIKVRGAEYLRIIYGPEYLQHLPRLRERGVGTKRGLAIKEFALGVEALHRFVERRPVGEVFVCAVGVLALEAEPVDPRL
jgi:protein phosphatase